MSMLCCPECGKIRPKGRKETWCVLCANTGHNFRLMAHDEIMATVHRLREGGYEEKADMRSAIAGRLALAEASYGPVPLG